MLRLLRFGFVGLLASGLASPVAADERADVHLLAGAAHFRGGRFEEAVVEFKVARALGAAGECPWYIAAALTRAGRQLDALEAFDEAQRLAPEAADALFLYYQGVACAELRLVVCAESCFERASAGSGPRVARQALKLASEARALLAGAPPRSAIDVLLERAAEHRLNRRPRLAILFAREARALAARREDRWREVEAARLAEPADGGPAAP